MSLILVSACLLGLRTRYDGSEKNTCNELRSHGDYVPVCPEQLGGLSTPREPADIENFTEAAVLSQTACVLTRSTKKDVSREFYHGAEETLRICRMLGIREAILKAGSPSCGAEGITAVILRNNGISVSFLG